jgi:hypothetical protein
MLILTYSTIADASEAPEERVYPVRVEDLHGGGAQGDLQVRGFPDLSGTLTRAGGTCAETGASMFKITCSDPHYFDQSYLSPFFNLFANVAI